MEEHPMHYPITHYLLARAQSNVLAAQYVERYIASSQLISYAEFFVRVDEVLASDHAQFWTTLEHGVTANHQFARRMLTHLQEEGVERLDQLLELKQGYATKVLHTLTHLLDGFIGVDSVFYNLVEDSHWVSDSLAAEIRAQRGAYWLVPVRTGMLEHSLLHPVD